MKRLFKHLRIYIFRGLLAIIPLGLCYFVVRFIYYAVDDKAARLIERYIGVRIPGLGLFLVLVILYVLGVVAGNWAGKRVFGFIERLMEKIPVVKSIYHLGKQIGGALALPEKKAFRRAVLIDNFRSGLYSIGFVTGEIMDGRDGVPRLKIFVPTAPNPTTGFMIIAARNEVRELDWTIEEAMNTVVSGGIIGPAEIRDTASPGDISRPSASTLGEKSGEK